jgi:hypothetical protein
VAAIRIKFEIHPTVVGNSLQIGQNVKSEEDLPEERSGENGASPNVEM